MGIISIDPLELSERDVAPAANRLMHLGGKMIRLFMAAILCAGLVAGGASGEEPKSELASIQGSWKGPWYRGMTSGIMVLQVAKEGSTRDLYQS